MPETTSAAQVPQEQLSGARAEVNLGRFPMRQTGPNFSGENPADHLAVDIGQTSLDTVVVEGEFFVINAQ